MTTDTATAIGILAGHGEVLVPTNPEYSRFFDFLRGEGRRTETIAKPIESEQDIADFRALLMGEPHQQLTATELDLLRKWIAAGGCLFVTASMGGDHAPAGITESSSNVADLFVNLYIRDDVLGRVVQTPHGYALNTQLSVDVSDLLGRTATLLYDTGCTLDLDGVEGGEGLLSVPPDAIQFREVSLRRGQVYSGRDYEPEEVNDNYPLLARVRSGKGQLLLFGSTWSFKDESLGGQDNAAFLSWLLPQWILDQSELELNARSARPQRHRLLHGYPMAPLMRSMPTDKPASRLDDWLNLDPARGLLVGVLPHTLCNPAVQGCGFCTFPHETYARSRAGTATLLVAEEIKRFFEDHPSFKGRRVDAVYFGGGTANLTPPETFATLCRALSDFDLSSAEVSLEGVPAYFLSRSELLDVLATQLEPKTIRLSMGIQTFDEKQLRRMGRGAFGDAGTVREVVARAHDRGWSVSGDLLFNLPGQTLEQMRQDVSVAIGAGLDQLCLYHLVMFEGLGTEWSRDRSLLAALPNNAKACEHWIALRTMLLENNFEQTLLTNFERSDRRGSDVYESSVLCPERCDWLGFGPSAISLCVDQRFGQAVKFINPETASAYADAMENRRRPWSALFSYQPEDVRLLYLTRKIAALSVEGEKYRALFGRSPWEERPEIFELLERRGLLVRDKAGGFELTAEGMFYADSVAGFLASRRVREFQLQGFLTGVARRPDRMFLRSNDPVPFRMG